MAPPQSFSVLTVCLGNICRSPMAEAVLAAEAKRRPNLDLKIDSAGTGAYHTGEPADSRTISTCKQHGIPCTSIARKVRDQDFNDFDYILAMDQSNLQALLSRKPRGSKARVALFGTFDPDLLLASPGSRKVRPKPIEDPYYGGRDGFETCYTQCVRFSKGFLDFLENGGGDVPNL